MGSRYFWSPVLAAVVAAGLLVGPLSGRASADGTVYGGPSGHIAFYTTTTINPFIYNYNVWLTYGHYVNYVTSYVYPDKWLLGTRNLDGCIELPNTYPDQFDAYMRYQMYDPGSVLVYNWYTWDFGPGDGLCQSGQQIFAYKRTATPEYVSKGGAFGYGAVKPWGRCTCTTVWTDYYWSGTTAMP